MLIILSFQHCLTSEDYYMSSSLVCRWKSDVRQKRVLGHICLPLYFCSIYVPRFYTLPHDHHVVPYDKSSYKLLISQIFLTLLDNKVCWPNTGFVMPSSSRIFWLSSWLHSAFHSLKIQCVALFAFNRSLIIAYIHTFIIQFVEQVEIRILSPITCTPRPIHM